MAPNMLSTIENSLSCPSSRRTLSKLDIAVIISSLLLVAWSASVRATRQTETSVMIDFPAPNPADRLSISK